MRSWIRIGLLLVAACSSSTGADGDKPRLCLDAPAVVDLAAPEISFRTTVVPLVQQNCSLPACHGDAQVSLGIYLPQDADKIYKALRAPATTNLKLDVVKPGEPSSSYMMHKLDGTQCALDADCVKGKCGQEMPPGEVLSAADRDAIRRWIAQGAKDN